ncbi:type IV pilus assembly protein PilM [Patescibacteria group bacterium]|nr:type IV pilus assembly protein PilM [Patescibacteria group bacterium]MBU1063097.1 type IV pilus assembly protein PilM [Patescibacteria group bacterium]
MFFNNNSNYPVGLDISDLSLKLVQLNKIHNKIKIQALGKINLPKGIIEDGIIKNQVELIKAIKTLIANPHYGKVSSEEIIACLPETKTFIKLIEIDKTPNPLEEIISQEIEKHIPMLLSEIYYDWQIVKNSLEKQSILIGVTPKNIVDQYSDLLDQAKLSIVALEIESISICRSLLTEEIYSSSISSAAVIRQNPQKIISKAGNYGIIDIGATRTSMIFYSKNTILFTVSMPISGRQITDDIATTLELSQDLAEKAKIFCGLDKSKAQGIIKNILTDVVKKLIDKIQESLEFYNSHFANCGTLEQILLCGGGANIKDLTQIIKQATNIEVKIGNSLINLAKVDEKFSKIFNEEYTFDLNLLKKNNKNNQKPILITQDINSTFATAIGLALRGIIIDEI